MASFLPNTTRVQRVQHADRAISLTAWRAAMGGLALAALLATGCSPASEGHASASNAPGNAPGKDPGNAPGKDPTASLEELFTAFEPIPPESTSDKLDAQLERKRAVMDALDRRDVALGKAAMAAFRLQEAHREDLRRALLEVAARADPVGTRDALASMVVTYDSQLGLGLRTLAAELLARTSPDKALEVIGPILADPKRQGTLPPREALVRAWALAASHVEGTDMAPLADLATDILQPPDARYAAIAELGKSGGSLARKALETVLTESVSDSYLRRKSAQALQEMLPPAELCPMLQRLSENEADPGFLLFLSDMLTKSCP